MSLELKQIRISPAAEKDTAALLRMVAAEAEYEGLTDNLTATEDRLRAALFGPRPVAEAIVAWASEQPVGFALFFTTFSTFSAQFGLYLEDLFVKEQWRGHGIGRELLAHVAKLAVERDCHSINWSVLKWNEKAIGFYRSLGAEQLEAWHHFHLAGSALKELAEKEPSA